MLERWKRKSLADLLEFRNGMNFTQASQGEQVKVIGVGDFKDKEVLNDFSETQSIPLNGNVNPDDLLKNDDLLFVRSNGNKALIGRCVLISGITEPVSFSGFTIRGRVKSNEIDHSFASKLVRSPLFKEHLHKMGGGSSINNLSQDTLSQFCFSLPPLLEQRKIAEILRTWDEAIEKLEALRAAKVKSRGARLQEILNDPDWPEVTVAELGTISSAGVDKKSVEGEKPVRLLNFVDVLRRDFLYDAEFSQLVTTTDRKIAACDVRKGDVFFTPSSETRDDIAHSAVAMETMPGVVYSYHVIRLRPTANLNLRFRAYLFKSNHFLKQAYALAAGSGQRYVLSQDQFRKMTVRLSKRETQEKVSAYFSTVDREIALIHAEIETLTRQKRGLMQKLLTGEWRVTC